MPQSESALLGRATRKLDTVIRRLGADGLTRKRDTQSLFEVLAMLETLQGQAMRGVHRNPSHRTNPHLVVFNPPGLQVRRVSGGRIAGQIASSVHEIKYKHADDGEDYKHEFGPGVKMFALEQRGNGRDILLTGELPLWEDF